MQKRTIQLAVHSVVFVGMMMIFLVSGLIEEADARIYAAAISQIGHFSDIRYGMDDGGFTNTPVTVGPVMMWTTMADESGEEGFVIAKVGASTVRFNFNNTIVGENTCKSTVTPAGSLQAGCWISQGNVAKAVFEVKSSGQSSDIDYCNMLNKFSGNEQSKIIREKLHCQPGIKSHIVHFW